MGMAVVATSIFFVIVQNEFDMLHTEKGAVHLLF